MLSVLFFAHTQHLFWLQHSSFFAPLDPAPAQRPEDLAFLVAPGPSQIEALIGSTITLEAATTEPATLEWYKGEKKINMLVFNYLNSFSPIHRFTNQWVHGKLLYSNLQRERKGEGVLQNGCRPSSSCYYRWASNVFDVCQRPFHKHLSVIFAHSVPPLRPKWKRQTFPFLSWSSSSNTPFKFWQRWIDFLVSCWWKGRQMMGVWEKMEKGYVSFHCICVWSLFANRCHCCHCTWWDMKVNVKNFDEAGIQVYKPDMKTIGE